MKINHDTESVAGAIGVSAETLAGIMTELMENDMPKQLSMLVELIVGTCRKTVLGDGGEPSSYTRVHTRANVHHEEQYNEPFLVMTATLGTVASA